MKTRWVLLRGWTRESAHWGEFRERFQGAMADAELYFVDLPGTGIRIDEKSPRSIVEIMERVRREVPPGHAEGYAQRTFLLGHSLGSMVALEWAARYPDSIAGAVLLSPSAGGISPMHHRMRPQFLWQVLKIMTTRDTVTREKRVLRAVSHASERPEVLGLWSKIAEERPISLKTTLNQLYAGTAYRPPAKVDRPLLILASHGDDLVNPACAETLARYLRTEIHAHESAKHDLALDAPEWVVEKIQEWMKSRMR